MGITFRHDAAAGLVGAYASGMASASRRSRKYEPSLRSTRQPASRQLTSAKAPEGVWSDPLAPKADDGPEELVRKRAAASSRARKYRLGGMDAVPAIWQRSFTPQTKIDADAEAMAQAEEDRRSWDRDIAEKDYGDLQKALDEGLYDETVARDLRAALADKVKALGANDMDEGQRQQAIDRADAQIAKLRGMRKAKPTWEDDFNAWAGPDAGELRKSGKWVRDGKGGFVRQEDPAAAEAKAKTEAAAAEKKEQAKAKAAEKKALQDKRDSYVKDVLAEYKKNKASGELPADAPASFPAAVQQARQDALIVFPDTEEPAAEEAAPPEAGDPTEPGGPEDATPDGGVEPATPAGGGEETRLIPIAPVGGVEPATPAGGGEETRLIPIAPVGGPGQTPPSAPPSSDSATMPPTEDPLDFGLTLLGGKTRQQMPPQGLTPPSESSQPQTTKPTKPEPTGRDADAAKAQGLVWKQLPDGRAGWAPGDRADQQGGNDAAQPQTREPTKPEPTGRDADAAKAQELVWRKLPSGQHGWISPDRADQPKRAQRTPEQRIIAAALAGSEAAQNIADKRGIQWRLQ